MLETLRNSVSKKVKNSNIEQVFFRKRFFSRSIHISKIVEGTHHQEISIMELLMVSILVHLIYDGLLEPF